MRINFNQYSTLSKTEWESIWEESIFILDTNVLLNLHRYNETTSNDLLQVFEQVSNQLWIPFQVALEYYENLESVTIEQVNQYVNVKNILESSTRKLKSELYELKLEKRHSRINTDNLIETIEDAIGDFQKDLDGLKKEQPIHHQRLHQKLQLLLEDKIGPAPKSQQNLDDLYKEAEERYKLNRPPGYMDTEKNKIKSTRAVYFHNDICYRRQYGDAIVWFQIITEAIKRKAKSVIFVTDDYKEDWWRIAGGQKRGPRYELIDEIQSKTGVEYFHLYSSDSFLEFAKQKYEIEVDEDSIQQIKKITKMTIHEPYIRKIERKGEQSVIDWIIQTNSDSQIFEAESNHFDIVLQDSIGKTAYANKFISWNISVGRYLDNIVYPGYFGISEGEFDKVVIIFFYDEENSQVHWSDIKELISNYFEKEENKALSENISVVVGFVREEIDSEGNPSNQFVPLTTIPNNI